jgi:WXG100 family type VII secretion target
MARIGADPAALRELKTTFDGQAQRIEELISTISGRLSNVYWEGPAAERFRSSWGSEFEPALRNLRSSLEECGVEIARRADVTEQAGS